MAEHPKVSIVMPVRDGAPMLPHALESLQNQTLSNWELVAVNDGSRDETADLLRASAEADRRIRIRSQPRLGIVAALQSGCAAARGEFIARMDADDWMAPERLQRQAEFLGRNPHIGLVACRVRHGGNASAQAGYAAHVAWINSLLQPREISLRRFVESPVAHPSVTFRRPLLQEHGGYTFGDYPEDYELWLRWMEAGVEFGKVEDELLIWNDLPNRLSRSEPRYRTEAFYQTKCVYLARWLKRHVTPSREIWLWGAGRVTRRRFRALETNGVKLTGFIDVDVKKTGRMRDGRTVAPVSELPSKERAFILAGVSKRGARELIAAELMRRKRVEGKDYLLVA